MFDAPLLPVEVDGAVVKRASAPEVLLHDRYGKPAMVRMRPRLLPGEMLFERLGRIPMILKDAPCPTPT